MIDLTLSRISTLLSRLPTPLTWSYIHVAGTNGKGSVCAHLTSVLLASSIRSGRFTSPHLVHRWDSIAIDGQPISKNAFLDAEETVKGIDKELGLGATEFEILTATAFEVFSRCKVKVAAVEVGMGGARDATNALAHAPLVGVVTSIGRDHEKFLGDGLVNIAREKAGIAKKGIPMVVDATNEEEVLEAIRKVAQEKEAGEIVLAKANSDEGRILVETKNFGKLDFGIRRAAAYQNANLACAVGALDILSKTFPSITADTIRQGVEKTVWPGRLQWLKLKLGNGQGHRLLIDGAHNEQGAKGLADFVEGKIRAKGKAVSWIIGMTAGKDIDSILRIFLRPGDSLTTVGFGEVDGMPWISCVPPGEISQKAQDIIGTECQIHEYDRISDEALEIAAAKENCTVVLAGSLYLIGELMGRYKPGTDAVISIGQKP